MEEVVKMVSLILGLKGTGKTKQLIELVNTAAKEHPGQIVLLEHGTKLKYDVHYDVRLVNAIEYEPNTVEKLQGFIAGLYAGNYDITKIYFDSLYKIMGCEDQQDAERLLEWLEKFGQKNNIHFVVTISLDPAKASDALKKFVK